MNFFKKLFEKKEQVSYLGLSEWLKAKESELIPNDMVEGFNSRLSELNNMLAEEALMLETAELMNDVPQRIMQIVEGNKNEVLRRLQMFKEWCKQPENSKETANMVKESEKQLVELSESTKKAFSILSEFYRDNVKQILAALSKYEDLFSEIAQKYTNPKLTAVYGALKILDDRKEEDEKKSLIVKRKEELFEHADKLKSKKSLLHIELSQLQNNHGLLAAKSRLHEFREKEAELQNKIREFFSPLQDAFVKYAHMAVQYEELLSKYAENPVSAFGADIKLDALSAIQGIRQSIDELGLKESKLEKTKQALDKIEDDELAAIHKDYANLSKLAGETEKSIQDSSVVKSMKEIENSLALIQLAETKMEEDIKSILKQIESFAEHDNKELIEIMNKIKPVTLMP